MNRRALVLTQSRSNQPAASAGSEDSKSALPAPNAVVHYMPVSEASQRMGFHAATLRRWLQEGAPYKPGSGGRSGRRVDPVELEQWYAARHQLPVVQARPLKKLLDDIADLFRDALKREPDRSANR